MFTLPRLCLQVRAHACCYSDRKWFQSFVQMDGLRGHSLFRICLMQTGLSNIATISFVDFEREFGSFERFVHIPRQMYSKLKHANLHFLNNIIGLLKNLSA